MILLVTDDTGAIHMTLDTDVETAKLYLEPGQSLAFGCSVGKLEEDKLCIRDGVIVQKDAADDLFDWGRLDDLPGEGQAVQIIWTAPANYEEDPSATAEGAQ